MTLGMPKGQLLGLHWGDPDSSDATHVGGPLEQGNVNQFASR